ncbi:MAG: DUF4394 domain-containing protein [Macromonas bipunctata]|nr:DUF4394 domain-containing protein [Macromonas bipunctata]
MCCNAAWPKAPTWCGASSFCKVLPHHAFPVFSVGCPLARPGPGGHAGGLCQPGHRAARGGHRHHPAGHPARCAPFRRRRQPHPASGADRRSGVGRHGAARAGAVARRAARAPAATSPAHRPGQRRGGTGAGLPTRPHGPTLYAWSSAGRLYVLDTASAALRAVSPPAGSGILSSAQLPHGVEVDPVQDQLRVIDATGRNWRVDLDTGIAIDADPARPGLQPDGRLVFAQRDWNAEATAQLLASAHSHHGGASTAFAIDRSTGSLVSQGSRAGARPVVSPNFGRLYTVGPLALAPLQDAAFDMAPRSQVALAAIRTTPEPRTGLYHINLDNGQARWLGWVGDGTALRGLAIQP